MARILVTGGAGFLGSHLCDRLVDDGHNVLCLDDLSTGNTVNPKAEFVRGDVIDARIDGLDEIYNLACPASPIHYQDDPVRTMKTCVFGALNMLEIARRTGAKILQASTSEVYGDPLEHPQTEDYKGNVDPAGPRACYDEGKRAAETLFYDFRRMYGTDIRVARIFNTYGPRMREDDGRVVSNFICQALRNKSLTIYGDGTQTRSFCYVDDLVDGLITLMASPLSVPVNLGNPVEYTVAQIAGRIIELTDSDSEFAMKSLPKDDPARRKPDISRALALDWKPTIDLDEGLSRTVEWFKTQLDSRKIA